MPATDAGRAAAGDAGPPAEVAGAPETLLKWLAAALVAAQFALALAQACQGLFGLACTALLALLTGAYAAIALLQLQRLRRRNRALQELIARQQHAQSEADAAGAAWRENLAGTGQEMRKPLHALADSLALLLEGGPAPRQIDQLRTASEATERLQALAADIGDAMQLERGGIAFTPGPVDLRGLLREAETRVRPQARARARALDVVCDPAVPERVLADAPRLSQIVIALLDAALLEPGRGAVTLTLRSLAAATPDPGTPQRCELEFKVGDRGAAVAGPLLVAANPATPHAGPAAVLGGLGLPNARRLAKLMGGEITVSGNPGGSRSHTLRLPVQVLRSAGAAVDPASPKPAGERALEVLVAEDHPINRQYMAALLEKLGHAAHFSADGLEAVQAARDRQFDVVLMDLHMPGLDGIAATRAIRALADPARSTVPIVGLTADVQAETRERCLLSGMNDFISKPVSPQHLAASLRRLFGTLGGTALPGPAAAVRSRWPADGEAPLIDDAAVTSIVQAMSREQLGALIRALLDDGPQTVERLRSAVRDARAADLRALAHAAHGAALNLGLAALAATAQALHDGAAHLPAHEIARLVQRYELLLAATRASAQASGLLGPLTE